MRAAAATPEELGAGSSIPRSWPARERGGGRRRRGGLGGGKGRTPLSPDRKERPRRWASPPGEAVPCCLCAKLGGERRAARRGPAHPRPRAVVAAAEWRGAPPLPPALEGGESSRLARLQGRFCVVSALRYETSRSSRRGAPTAPAPAGGMWGPRAAPRGRQSPERELWDRASLGAALASPRGREPSHQRQTEEISRSARTAAPLTWS